MKRNRMKNSGMKDFIRIITEVVKRRLDEQTARIVAQGKTFTAAR